MLSFILLLEGGSTLAWMWHVSGKCSVSFPSSWLYRRHAYWGLQTVLICLSNDERFLLKSTGQVLPKCVLVLPVCGWSYSHWVRWPVTVVTYLALFPADSEPNLKFNVQRLNKEVFRNLALLATWSIVSSQLHISVLWWTHPELLLRQVMILPHKRNSQQPASKLFESISRSLRLCRVSGWHPSSFRWLLCQ